MWKLGKIVNRELKGDRILLPATCLSVLSEQGLSFPLIFQIESILATVKEFTAESGTVEISPILDKNLKKDEQLQVVLVKDIETCTFIQLVPMTPQFAQVEDPRALLEVAFRLNYSTITESSMISIQDSYREYMFRVEKVEPAPRCKCLETDVEVDIVPKTAEMSKAMKEAKFSMNHIMDYSLNDQLKLTGSLNKGEYQHLKLIIESSGILNLSVESSNGDVDIFVAKDKKADQFEHHFRSVDSGNCSLQISVESKEYFVALYGYLTSKYVFTANMQQPDDNQGISCSFCFKKVPEASLTLHEITCRRINTFCSTCEIVMSKEAYNDHTHCLKCKKGGSKANIEKHLLLEHQPIICQCTIALPLDELLIHKQNECCERMIICRFCHLAVRAGPKSLSAKDIILGQGLSQHESDCGARTLPCTLCNKLIQLKDHQLHHQTHQQLDFIRRKDQPLPLVCSNHHCSYLQDPHYSNPMKMCKSCYAPFYSPSHDPNHRKLIQKMVEKYHQQLTKGCGQSLCSNEYCASNGLPMESTEAAIKAYQLYQQGFIDNPKNPAHFYCTDPENYERFKFCLQLQEVSTYPLSWCILAWSKRHDFIQALEWLQKYAPPLAQ